MVSSYVPLVSRSNFSLLTGTASVERLVERAGGLALPYLALTDRNSLYGAIPFYQQAKEAGIKPILGAEIVALPKGSALAPTLLRGGERSDAPASSLSGPRERPIVSSPRRSVGTSRTDGGAVLLARDYSGYSSLCKIISRRHLEEDFSLPDALAECQEGLHVLTEDAALAGKLAGRIDRDRLWLVLAYPGRSATQWRTICEQARETGISLVATADVYFLDEEEFPIHQVLAAIRENTLVSRLKPGDVADPKSSFVPPAELERLFRDHPDALRNNLRIAEDCNLDLPLGKPIFPRYSFPDGETPQSFLRKLCFDGLKCRCKPVTRQATDRLRHELEVIGKLGFTEYFIFVWDILRYALEQGIPTVGRGSGASSMVAYVLGITQADPVRYHIPFERFLHMQRADCPDLDVDLCWIKRDQLIASIYERFGASRVAMVATHNTFRLRSAFREVAKALGVPNDVVNRMSAKLAHDSEGSVRDAVLGTGARELLTSGPKTFETLAGLAESIRGFPRHLGIHCGGLVIGDKPLENYVPLERATKGIVVTQYEKDAIEAIGLVKMDFLGNHGLTIRDETLQRVKEIRGVELHVDEIPDDDSPCARLLANAQTLSCCQLESPAMRNLLRMLRASNVKELMQALALIRPAPASAGMKEEFVRRARGIDAWVAPHPSLRGVLSDTYGIMLYEDDAMLVASALGGIPLEEADLLRRAISKAKSREKLAEISRHFLGKAAVNGVPPQVAQDLWVQMAKFNSYSFCKAHAASYAILAYQLAYLKAHYPLEFMAAVLNHQWGMYPKWVHLEEARRLGLNVLGPCVNHSDGQFTIESSPPLRGGIDFRPGGAGHVVRLSEADSSRPGGAGYIDGAIRVGLRQVKGLTERSIRRILAERGRRLFASLGDFLARVPVTDPEAENLILCGAFDFSRRSRPDLLLDLKTTDPAERGAGGRDGFGFGSWEPPKPPRLKDFSPEQKLVHELTILGLSPGKHPLAVLRESLRAADLVDSDALPQRIGRTVRIAGVVAALRTATTKNDGVMLFVSLEDEKGVFEVTLFPQVHKRFGHLIDGFGPYVVEGKVADQYGALTVEARKVTALAASQGWMGLGNDE